jgi:hypothetical protein
MTRLETIPVEHGHRSVSGLNKDRIKDKILAPLADRPGAALDTLKKLRILIKHAIEKDWLPSLGVCSALIAFSLVSFAIEELFAFGVTSTGVVRWSRDIDFLVVCKHRPCPHDPHAGRGFSALCPRECLKVDRRPS